MTSDLALLWLAAFPLMGSPGPATLSLAAMGAAYGGRRSLSYLAGINAMTNRHRFTVDSFSPLRR